MSQYQYRPLTPGTSQFRILHLQPGQKCSSTESSSVVSCSLNHDCLDDYPSYIALSYTWGSASQLTPILIDGATWEVTLNLEAALRYLSCSQETPVHIWIDALCIDQANNEEKNEQLAYMQRIYQQAELVIAWLGPLYEDSDVAMEWIATSGSLCLESGIRTTITPTLLDILKTIGTPDEDGLADKPRQLAVTLIAQLLPSEWHYKLFSSLKCFFDRPYWKRIWIVQEIASASKLVFACGESTLDYQLLYDAIFLLTYMATYQSTQRTLQEGHSTHSTQEFLLKKIRTGNPTTILKHKIEKEPPPLCYIIRSFRRFLATDPRDKVFALLGMSRDADLLGLRADYNKPCSEVYRDVTRRLVSAGYLDILSLVRFPKPIAGLPSWAPDLSRDSRYSPLQQRALDRDSGSGVTVLEPPFSAAGGTRQCLGSKLERCEESTAALSLCGAIVDEIGHLGRFWDKFNVEVSVGRWLEDFYKLSLLISDTYPLRERREDAMWRAAVADRETRGGARIPRLDQQRVMLACNAFKDKYTELDKVNQKTLAEVGLFHYCEQLKLVARNRRPIVTSGGHLGLGPLRARVGDVIAVIPGSDTPYILRRGKEGFQLVGETYLHGLMDGEAMEKHPTFEMFAIR